MVARRKSDTACDNYQLSPLINNAIEQSNPHAYIFVLITVPPTRTVVFSTTKPASYSASR